MDSGSFAAKVIAFITAFTGWKAYAAILGVLTICGLGVPIPEDITLIAAGILASMNNISLAGALIAGFIGVMIGDTILFVAGRKFGRRVFTLPLFRRVFTPERIALAEKKVLRNSKFICFTARFLPGLRSPIFLTAGIMGVRPLVFFALDGGAALVSVPVWVVGGWWFGSHLDEALDFAKRMQVSLLVGLAFLIGGYILVKRIRKKRRKAQLSKPSAN
ncbi:MAG: DedA family protein [Bdellovibrionales bacterium]|nr:DedA family protein [Bdellovibrionales bacterium]